MQHGLVHNHELPKARSSIVALPTGIFSTSSGPGNEEYPTSELAVWPDMIRIRGSARNFASKIHLSFLLGGEGEER